MASTRSIRNGSVTGIAHDASTTSTSMFATAGRMNSFRRGKTASTVPFAPCREISTKSPTSGETFSRRIFPRARHSTTPSAVCT